MVSWYFYSWHLLGRLVRDGWGVGRKTIWKTIMAPSGKTSYWRSLPSPVEVAAVTIKRTQCERGCGAGHTIVSVVLRPFLAGVLVVSFFCFLFLRKKKRSLCRQEHLERAGGSQYQKCRGGRGDDDRENK